MKKIFFILLILSFSLPLVAQNLEIIPEAKGDAASAVNAVGVGGEVRKNYNLQAQELQKNGDLGTQMASGIFTWDTLLDYLSYLIKFLSEAGIFVGACFIIYAGYLYASNIFTGKDPSAGNTAIKNAVIGVIVITFSYAIMKAITSAFLT